MKLFYEQTTRIVLEDDDDAGDLYDEIGKYSEESRVRIVNGALEITGTRYEP